MKISRSLITFGVLLGGLSAVHATSIGFANLGGDNTTVPSDLGSFASADGNGYTVSVGGTTPNVALVWDANWDIHTSSFFQALEDKTMGGTPWDVQSAGDRRIGQLDISTHTIQFFAESGYAVVLSSFDFGQTGESDGSSTWDLTLTDSGANVVWSQTVDFVSSGGEGQVDTITPDFTGVDGEIYTLTFHQTTTYPNGRVGIDNLTFSQVAVPEPGVVTLLGAAGLALLLRRRK